MCIVPSSEKSTKEEDHSGLAMICATGGTRRWCRALDATKNCHHERRAEDLRVMTS
jgi:hypothetical protein